MLRKEIKINRYPKYNEAMATLRVALRNYLDVLPERCLNAAYVLTELNDMLMAEFGRFPSLKDMNDLYDLRKSCFVYPPDPSADEQLRFAMEMLIEEANRITAWSKGFSTPIDVHRTVMRLWEEAQSNVLKRLGKEENEQRT